MMKDDEGEHRKKDKDKKSTETAQLPQLRNTVY